MVEPYEKNERWVSVLWLGIGILAIIIMIRSNKIDGWLILVFIASTYLGISSTNTRLMRGVTK